MGFLPRLAPHDEKVLLFYCFKKKKKRRDQHRLMKGSSLKSAATTQKKELHFISEQHHHSPTACLSSSCLSPAGDIQWSHIRSRTDNSQEGVWRFFFCQCIVISRDALHNGCQRCLEWDSCTSCCFAELLRNVSASVGLCASEPLRIIVHRFLADSLLFLMGCGISHCGVCFRKSIVIRPICRPAA